MAEPTGIVYHYATSASPTGTDTVNSVRGLLSLVKSGTVKPDTLIWTDGWANWVALSEAPCSYDATCRNHSQGKCPFKHTAAAPVKVLTF
jgi:hypothetical protein